MKKIALRYSSIIIMRISGAAFNQPFTGKSFTLHMT